jgi:hypothetical protein
MSVRRTSRQRSPSHNFLHSPTGSLDYSADTNTIDISTPGSNRSNATVTNNAIPDRQSDTDDEPRLDFGSKQKNKSSTVGRKNGAGKKVTLSCLCYPSSSVILILGCYNQTSSAGNKKEAAEAGENSDGVSDGRFTTEDRCLL